MEKIITLLLLVALMQQGNAQSETFDIATYTSPKDWKKLNKPGVVIYTNTNEVKGAFCMIAIYESTASTGKAAQDFTEEWNDLAVGVYGAAPAPKTETQTSPEGWMVVAGAAPVVQDSVSSFIVLTVFSGFGKRMSVLSNLNDQSYLTTIDSLLQNMKLDKNAKVAAISETTSTLVGTKESNESFGSVKYIIPQGWKVTKYPDGDILAPTDLPEKEFLEIWVQEPLNFSGTIDDALKLSYDETAEKLEASKMSDVNGGNYSKVAEKVSFRGWQYIRCSGGIHMGGGEYPPEYGLDLFLIKVNDHFERIAIIKSRNNCNMSRYYPSDRLKYYYDIENYLFSLQFTGYKEPIIKTATLNGDGIIGVWQGISLSVGMAKPGAELGAEYKSKQLIFFSNGQAYFGNNFPTQGLDQLNTWVMAELNRRDWGTYSFVNGKGVLKLPYADIPLRMEVTKLILNTNKAGHGFIKINSVDCAKFNASYALSSKDFAGGETGKTPLISFTTDGKFTDNGAVNVLYHEYIDCLNAGKEPGNGEYEIKSHSVIFHYTDGRVIKIAFIGTDYRNGDTKPATISLSFNENLLRRQ